MDNMFSKIPSLKVRKLTIANAVDIFVGEDAAFMIVGPVTCLFDDGGRKTISIGLVVSKL